MWYGIGHVSQRNGETKSMAGGIGHMTSQASGLLHGNWRRRPAGGGHCPEN